MSIKDTTTIIKEWVEIVKSCLIMALSAIALYLLINDSPAIRKYLISVGITKGTVLGVEFDLASASDALPRTESALDQAKVQLEKQKRDYDEAVKALEKSQMALASKSGQEKEAATLSIAQVLKASSRNETSTGLAAAAIQQAQNETRNAIATLPGSNNTSSGFGIVFGGDHSLQKNRDQLARATGVENGIPKVFRRDNTYRTVMVFSDKEHANAALPAIRSINQYAAQAYIVNLASWCPNADLHDDPVKCDFQ